MRKVTKRLNYDRLSKTKSVWNITSWVFLFIKENSYKTSKILSIQFDHMLLRVFNFFFIKKFATLCNEKIMPNLKGLNNQNKAFIYFINKEYINIVWSSPIRYHRFAKCTKSFSCLKLSVCWNCSRVYCRSEKVMQIQFTRNKLALHLIFIKKWNGIHFFLKHLESFLGVPE